MNNIDEMGVHVNGVNISVIMYANDLVLIAKDKHGLQLGMNVLCEYCMENDLTVNTNKSHLMHVSRKNQPISQKFITMIRLLPGLTVLDISV